MTTKNLIADWLSHIDAALFRNEMMDVEPESRKKRRAVVEKALNGNIESLPVPFGRALPLGAESLRQLTRAEFRCVVRVIATIQMKAFNMDSSSHCPLLIAFGNALHLNGNRPLVSFANQVGMSPCYQFLEKEKKLLFDVNSKKQNADKVDGQTFHQFQWDNIDTRKTFNWLRVLGTSIDYHGTIFTAQETAGLPAVRGPIHYTVLRRDEFPEPSDMLFSPRVYQEAHLRDAQALFCGLAYCFKENLLSTDKSCSVSLEFLLKNSLQFHHPPEMASTKSENVEIFSLPSNSADTAKKVIDTVLEISRKNAGHTEEASVCALTGDNPLYLRMISVIYKYFGSERGAEYSTLSPQLGLMHCSMAFFDAIKYLSFDSVLDALIKDSGFSKGSQDGFRSLKDFKSNLRFFQQATCALLIRMIDELIDEAFVTLAVRLSNIPILAVKHGLCHRNVMIFIHYTTLRKTRNQNST